MPDGERFSQKNLGGVDLLDRKGITRPPLAYTSDIYNPTRPIDLPEFVPLGLGKIEPFILDDLPDIGEIYDLHEIGNPDRVIGHVQEVNINGLTVVEGEMNGNLVLPSNHSDLTASNGSFGLLVVRAGVGNLFLREDGEHGRTEHSINMRKGIVAIFRASTPSVEFAAGPVQVMNLPPELKPASDPIFFRYVTDRRTVQGQILDQSTPTDYSQEPQVLINAA